MPVAVSKDGFRRRLVLSAACCAGLLFLSLAFQQHDLLDVESILQTTSNTSEVPEERYRRRNASVTRTFLYTSASTTKDATSTFMTLSRSTTTTTDLYQWPQLPRRHKFNVTFSLISMPTEEDLRDLRRRLAALLGALEPSSFDVRQVIVDADPARKHDKDTVKAYFALLESLVQEGVLTQYAVVRYDHAAIREVYKRIFHRPDAYRHTHSGTGKGFLSYITEYDTCTTDYLLHFDFDVELWSAGVRDGVRDLVALLQKCPECVSAALPIGLGSHTCKLDAPVNCCIRARWNSTGFVDLGTDFSTQSYFLDLHRFRERLPLPLDLDQVEYAFGKLAKGFGGRSRPGLPAVHAMLPYVHPPVYFRSVGSMLGGPERFKHEVKAIPSLPACRGCGRESGSSCRMPPMKEWRPRAFP